MTRLLPIISLSLFGLLLAVITSVPTMVALFSGSPGVSFHPAFWTELEELLGPILQPIVHPIFEALDNEQFRGLILVTLITAVITGIAITFLIYEFPVFIGWISSPTGATPRERRLEAMKRKTPSTYRLSRKSQQTRKREERDSRPVGTVQSSGVQVNVRLEKKWEQLILYVDVINKGDQPIQMVVVDIEVPAGIETAIGSFRMQRLGTIESGEKQTVEFTLKDKGGRIRDLGGYVEFLSSMYETSRILLPSPTGQAIDDELAEG